ncbi:MAG: alpha/beta hydrolase [Chitinophagales bacterium]|nr:alpha/beta hydrolase [Bacteroidota bacterium]
MKKITIYALLFALLILNLYANAQSDTNTTSFKVEQTGQGETAIVFIPGFACSGDVWDSTIIKFENKFTCYTLTMPGFAGVPAQSEPTFNAWKNEIANFIKSRKLQHTILVGHSMGGGLAMSIAADYPELISKIVIVDALPCLSALMNPNFKSVENIDCSTTIQQMTSTTNDQFYRMQKLTMKQLVADTTKQKVALNWSMQSDRKTFAKMYCDFTNTDLREKIKNISCPTLVLLEPSFKDLKPEIEAQYKLLKNVQFAYANKGLHFIMYDDFSWYINQLESFINKTTL